MTTFLFYLALHCEAANKKRVIHFQLQIRFMLQKYTHTQESILFRKLLLIADILLTLKRIPSHEYQGTHEL